MSNHITVKGKRFTAVISSLGIVSVRQNGAQQGMSPADMATSIMFWLPDIITQIVEDFHTLTDKLAKQQEAKPGAIQPMETAPRDGTRVDIWVKDIGSSYAARRIPDAAYSDFLSHPHQQYSKERYSGWYSHGHGSYLDEVPLNRQVVGWAPIAEAE